MDISNIQGANAYTANRQAGENTQVRNQAPAQTDPTAPEAQGEAQKAFEVTITQEARNQLAAETQVAAETQSTDQKNQARQTQVLEAAQTAAPAQQAPSQIVNIVA